MSGDKGVVLEKQRVAVTAKGEPAALSPTALQTLMRGERDATAERLMASQPIYKTERPTGATKARFSPVAIGAEEVTRLSAEGATPDSVLTKLDRSAKQRGRFGAQGERKDLKARPSERPSER